MDTQTSGTNTKAQYQVLRLKGNHQSLCNLINPPDFFKEMKHYMWFDYRLMIERAPYPFIICINFFFFFSLCCSDMGLSVLRSKKA
jgi:hypothetical protein